MKKIKMSFHCAGVTSFEDLKVMSENDTTIELERGEGVVWIFNKKTGKCLNDETSFGARRTIEPIR